jgi:hypothetical protein
VTASEFAFLAMGLILGVAAGAALIEFVRARPPTPREVRVTMATDAVPRRRAATLANDAFTESPVAVDPASMGPADRGGYAPAAGQPTSGPRTTVLAPPPPPAAEPVFRLTPPPTPGGAAVQPPTARPVAQGVPVSTGGVDPMLTALRASAAASAEAAMATAERPVAIADPPEDPPATIAKDGGNRGGGRGKAATSDGTSVAVPPGATATGPCADARRLADERCELAGRARAQAIEAQEAHRAAQRAYDDHESGMAVAAAAADPRAVREAKDEAQARFRAGRSAARDADEVEAVAREWLHEINRINAQTGDARARLAAAQARTPELAVLLEQTGLEADGARVAAEAAEGACVSARQAVADCEERAAGRVPSPAPDTTASETSVDDGSSETLVAALRAGGSPRIVRLLRGDRAAMQEIVTTLGGDDADGRRRWQVAMSDLVDAIFSDAIAASALEFPGDHSFWAPFDRSQARDITSALSSLGYRFDGRGGWVDGRQPSQRDLSLALGYAGLDPMRIRQWPNEAEMSTLYADVQVSAAEHLAETAGDLTLGELVTMLGRRADGLADIWNDWGRIRPLLLDET